MKEKYWHTRSGFKNPEGSFLPRVWSSFGSLRWILGLLFHRPYKLGTDLPPEHVLSPREAAALREKHKDRPSVTWLGHAAFLFTIGNKKILTDPFLWGRVGPFFVRKLKRLPQPVPLSEIAGADILLISHEHMDHLHKPSLRRLKIKKAVLPLGLGKKLRKYVEHEPAEIDWFESQEIDGITITAVPAQHYSNLCSTTLWAGFVIAFKDEAGAERKIYFSGDSGYGPFVKRDVAPYGPFDLACIGAGAYYLKFPSRAPVVHMNTEEAVQAAKDIRAKKVTGMHWGTIRMTDEDPNATDARMQAHARSIGYEGEVVTLRIGETIAI